MQSTGSQLTHTFTMFPAVAVSGGCDSMALTYLATKLFDRVIGITVDHKLRDGSSEEAERTSHLVTSLGAQQHTLTLDWGSQGLPPLGKLQVQAREKRYMALLNMCRDMDIQTLLVAHHLNDQHETFMLRFAMGSNVDGLGGMYPVTRWPGFPQTNIVRPLLELHKCDLVEVCKCEGVEWVEDPTNQTMGYIRNHYRKVLQDNPRLVNGIEDLVRSCDQARSVVKQPVRSSVLSLSKVNTKHGYLTIKLNDLLSLPPPIARRVLWCLIRYISDSKHHISYKQLDKVYKSLVSYKGKNMSAGRANITSLANGVIGICKSYPSNERIQTPIQVGETILWENRWEITLKLQKNLNDSKRRNSSKELDKDGDDYFVRNMVQKDWDYAVRGVRKIRKASLPPVLVRGSLPVIVDTSGYVVLIPHFEFHERFVNVTAQVVFKPRYSLEDALLSNYI